VAGIGEDACKKIICYVRKMETYLETLAAEFRDHYKELSDKQQGYEAPTEMIGTDSPNFPWNFKNLSNFVREAEMYQREFEEPLDEVSGWLRQELARILSSKSGGSHIKNQSNDPVAHRPYQDNRLSSRGY
jgi:hypothetical protein